MTPRTTKERKNEAMLRHVCPKKYPNVRLGMASTPSLTQENAMLGAAFGDVKRTRLPPRRRPRTCVKMEIVNEPARNR
jgi:hypothetical protein